MQRHRDMRDVFCETLISNDHKKARRILLDKTIDINEHYRGQTHFQWSITQRSLEAARLLIENENWDFGDVYEDILGLSTPGWLFDILEMLLENWDCCNVDLNDGSTPLLWALKNSGLQIMNLLLDNGADHAARDWNRKGTLHYAIRNSDVNVVPFVLDKKSMQI